MNYLDCLKRVKISTILWSRKKLYMLWVYKERLHEQPNRKMNQSFKQAIHRGENIAIFIRKRKGRKGGTQGGKKGGKDWYLVWLLGESSVWDGPWI